MNSLFEEIIKNALENEYPFEINEEKTKATKLYLYCIYNVEENVFIEFTDSPYGGMYDVRITINNNNSKNLTLITGQKIFNEVNNILKKWKIKYHNFTINNKENKIIKTDQKNENINSSKNHEYKEINSDGFIRDIYTSDTFERSFDEYKNYNPKNKEEIENDFYKIVNRYQKISKNEILNQKHIVYVKDSKNLPVYKIRSTDHDNLCRLYFSFGKDFKKCEMKEDDIVFLFCTIGEEKHDNYKKIINRSDFRENNEAILIDEYEFHESNNKNIYYKIIKSKKDNQYHLIPAISQTQIDIIKNNNPPIVVTGCAGSGKTTTSIEAYKQYWRNNPNSNIVYVTYLSRLRDQVKTELEYEIPNANCITIDELLSDQYDLGKGNYKYVGSDNFSSWIKSESTKLFLNQRKIKLFDISGLEESAISIIYIFFRTYSFQDENIFSNYKLFYEKVRKENGISEKQWNIIFTICSEYEKYLIKNDLYTDNRLSSILININHKLFDCIIVDEIQDLTKNEINFLFSSLNKGYLDFYAFGDDNQSINPSLIRLDEIETYLKEELKNYTVSQNKECLFYLPESYRSSSYLCKYLNYLIDVKNNIIGKSSYDKEILTIKQNVSDNSMDRPAFVINNLGVDLLSQDLFDKNDVVVIVPNLVEKQKLVNKYSQSIKSLLKPEQKSILSIDEMKGMETSIVILYNFFSSSQDVWINMLNHLDNKEHMKSTIDRMYFNRYYVGLTRAKDKVIIVENKDLDTRLQNLFFFLKDSSLNKNNKYSYSLSEIKNIEKYEEYFKNNYTSKLWYEKAVSLFNDKDYEMAYDRIQKAKETFNEEENYISIIELDKYINKFKMYFKAFSNDALDPDIYQKCIETFIFNNDIESLSMLYKKYEKDKYELLSNIESNNYIKIFEQFDKSTLIDIEKEYFYLKAISKYSTKIINQLED